MAIKFVILQGRNLPILETSIGSVEFVFTVIDSWHHILPPPNKWSRMLRTKIEVIIVKLYNVFWHLNKVNYFSRV